MMKIRYSIRELEVVHYGDYLTELTARKNRVVFINYLSLIKGDSHMILQILPSSKSSIEEALDLSKSYGDVKYAEVLRGAGFQPFLFMIKKNYGVLKALAEVRGLKVGPVIVSGGVKKFPILISREEENKLKMLVKKYSPVEVKVKMTKPTYLRYIESPLLSSLHLTTTLNLTEREFQVLKKAYEEGYFEWPRRIDLNNLAKELNLSKPTVLEYIRKAERKILKHYLETLYTDHYPNHIA